MTQTFDMVDVAVAIKKAEMGDYSPTTYSEFVAEAEKRGLIKTKEIRDLGKQISINSNRIFERRSKGLSAALKWRERVQAYADGVAQFQLTGDRKTWDNLNRNLDSAIKESKKILHEHAQVDVPYYNSLRSVAQSNQKGGAVNETAAWFKTALDTNPFQLGAGESTYDFGDPGVRAAHRDFFKEINSQGRYIFDIAPEGADDAGMIRNLAELSDPKASEKGGLLHGLMSGAGIQIILEDNQHNQLEAYNRDQKTGNDTKKLVADQVQKTQAIRNSMGAPDLSPKQYFELSNQARDYLIGIEEVANKRGQFDIDDMEQLEKELADVTELEEQNKILKAEQQKLIAGSPNRADTLKLELAHGISSPWIHAWAADHGFDELGRVDVDKDNMLLVDTYVQGRDDLAAMRAFVREQERGAGRYGFRSIGSGETVQVMIDGEVITGERLKYHAADRPGVVRIAVPDREDPILIVSPGDIDGPIVVLSTDRDKVSPGVNRAKALLFRKGGAIKAAGQEARRVDVASVAKVGEEFIVDESGQHVDAKSYAEQVANKVVAKTMDDQTYLVDADGTVYLFDEETNSASKLDEDSPKIDDVMSRPSRRVLVFTKNDADRDEGEEDGARLVLGEDLTRDDMGDIIVELLEGENGYDATLTADIDKEEAEGLGYSLVSEFRPEKAQTYENPRNVGGMPFATLKEVEQGAPGTRSTTVAEPVSEPEVAPEPETPEPEVVPVDEVRKPSPEDFDLDVLEEQLKAEAEPEAAPEPEPTPVPTVETPEPEPEPEPIHDDPKSVETWEEPEVEDKAAPQTDDWDQPLDIDELKDQAPADAPVPGPTPEPAPEPDKRKVRLGDVLSQVIFPRKAREKEEAKASQDKREVVDQERQEEDREQSRREKLAKARAELEAEGVGLFGEKSDDTEDADDTDDDEASSDAGRVKGTPSVTGKNTDPQKTPKTQTADELEARRAADAEAAAAAKVAAAKAAADAVVPATPPDTVPTNTTTNRYQNRGRGAQ